MEQLAPPKSRTQLLYEAMSKSYGDKLPDYETFEKGMANPETRVKVYNLAKRRYKDSMPAFDVFDKSLADEVRQKGGETASAYDEPAASPEQPVDQPGMTDQQMAEFLQPIPVNEPKTTVDKPGTMDSLAMNEASTTAMAPNPQQPQAEVNLDDLEYDTPGAMKFAFDAINRGILQGEQSNILNVGDEKLSDKQIENLASVSKRLQSGSLPRSPAYEKFINSKGLGESLKALTESPQATGNIIAELTLESLAALITHGSLRAGTGAVTGGTMGSLAPGIGTAAGAALGAVSGLGLSSLNLEYTGSILGSLQEAGVDITDADSLKKGFENDEMMSDAKALALKRGVPIAVWDMMSAGVAGRITSQPAKTILRKAGQISSEMGLQAGMGMAGEGQAQATTGEPVNWSAILAEGIGELGGGAPEVVAGTMARKQQTTTDNGKEQKVQTSEPSAGGAGDVAGQPTEQAGGLADEGSVVIDNQPEVAGTTPRPNGKATTAKKPKSKQPASEVPVESQEDIQEAAERQVQQEGAEPGKGEQRGDGKERVAVEQGDGSKPKSSDVLTEDVKPEQKADIPKATEEKPADEQAGGEADTATGGDVATGTQADAKAVEETAKAMESDATFEEKDAEFKKKQTEASDRIVSEGKNLRGQLMTLQPKVLTQSGTIRKGAKQSDIDAYNKLKDAYMKVGKQWTEEVSQVSPGFKDRQVKFEESVNDYFLEKAFKGSDPESVELALNTEKAQEIYDTVIKRKKEFYDEGFYGQPESALAEARLEGEIDELNKAASSYASLKTVSPESVTQANAKIDEIGAKNDRAAEAKPITQTKPKVNTIEEFENIRSEDVKSVRDLANIDAGEQAGLLSGAVFSQLKKGDEFTVGGKKYTVTQRTKPTQNYFFRKSDSKRIDYKKSKITIKGEDGKPISGEFWEYPSGSGDWMGRGQTRKSDKWGQLSRNIEGDLNVDLINEFNKFHNQSDSYRLVQQFIDDFNKKQAPKQNETKPKPTPKATKPEVQRETDQPEAGGGVQQVPGTETGRVETTEPVPVQVQSELKPEETPERKRVNFEVFGEKRSGSLTETITDEKGNPIQYKVTDSNGVKRIVTAIEPAAGRKVYSEPIGAGKTKGTDRIQPSPVFGQATKKLTDITLDLRKASKSPIFFTKSPSGRRRSLGSYNPRSAAVAIKYTNDLDTLAHEIGHSMDDKYGVLSKMEGNVAAMEKELIALSKYGSKPPKGHPDPKLYRLGEGVAEYFRGYVVNPGEARQRAPEFTRWAERAIPNDAWIVLNNFSNDVRAFAGGTAHESIMSNVQMDPSKAKGTIMEKLKPSSTSKENFEITVWDRLAKSWLNDLRPFEKSIEFLQAERGIDRLNPSEDPRILARVFAGVTERMDNMFREGLADIDNQRVKDEVTGENMTMNWLFEPLDNSTEQSIHNEVEETLSYMIAERTNELGDRFGKDILTGIGGGIFKDRAIAQKRLAEHQAMPEEKRNRIEEAARRYRAYSDTVLRYMVDAGRMSETAYNTIRENNLQYVALNRVLEAAPGEEIQIFQKGGGKAIASSSNVINKIKGSTRTIKNPYASLLDFTYRAYKESDRNRVMQSFRELFTLDRGMYQGDPAALAQVARKATESDKNTVKVFIDGKPEHWQLQEDVYASVKRITDQATRLPGWLTAMARLTRWTVTNFPVFAARNRVRDFAQRLVISNTGPTSGYDIYFNRKLKKEVKSDFQLFGGGQGGHYLMNEDFYYTQMEIAIRDMAERKDTIIADAGKIMTKFGDGYKRVMSSSETATRLEEYRSAFKKAKRQGMDDYNASLYAAFQARDLMDFSIAGEYVRAINQVVPFTNAAVQGISKTVRSAKQNPVGFATRWAIYAAIPALANRLIVHAMDKDDEYEELPAYQRDLFYNVPLDDDLWLSIPKPFEIGVMASGAERLMSKMMGYEEAFEGYAGSVARSTMPVDDAALVGPARGLVEVISNFDFFRQKNIIPPQEDKKALELRRTGTASRLGQSLQKIIGADARNIDHIIKAQTTYFGDLALRLSDLGRDDSRYQLDETTMGFFKNTPVYNSKSVQWVMEKAQLYGLTQDPIYQQMSLLVTDYFNATTDEEKEKRGRVIRKFAKDIKKTWTELGIEEEMVENPQDFKVKSIKELIRKSPKKEVGQAARRSANGK